MLKCLFFSNFSLKIIDYSQAKNSKKSKNKFFYLVTLIHTLLLIEPFSIPAPQYRIYHGLPIKWVGPRGEL